MTKLFLNLINMSITAGWIVVAVVILRLLLQKAPKWISCVLWSIVALRLVIPISLESVFSLVPSAEVFPQDIVTSQTPAIHSGIPAVNSAINPLFTEHITPGENQLDQLLFLGEVVWVAGVAAMLLYSAVTYFRLRRQLRVSVLHQKNIYVCDAVESPFILGIFRPRIYLSSGVDEQQLPYVLAHENAHIRRRDHWWKPLGFLLLSVYWFNPLLWLAYILLCRDIEQACDEKVIAHMDIAGKKGYSKALVDCSVHRRMVRACPVAFGEVGVKTRIKGVLSYKKPAFWIMLVSLGACTVAAVCFLTNPKPCEHDYHGQITVSATCTQTGVETRTCRLCEHSYTVRADVIPHNYDEGTVTAEPTCTREGVKTFACLQCGHSYTEGVELLPHSYDGGTVAIEPSCIQPGSMKYACADCGAVKTEELGKTGHTAGETFLVKEPNCTEKGQKAATCTLCQTVYLVEILETNEVHDLEETVLVEATCGASGEGVLTCTRCDHSESCAYEPLKHNYVDSRTGRGNCSVGIDIKMVCTGCGDHYWKEWYPPSTHEWMGLSAPWRDRCRFCGAIKPEGLPKYLTEPNYQPDPDPFPVVRWDWANP